MWGAARSQAGGTLSGMRRRGRAPMVDFRGRPDDAFVQQTDAGRNRAIVLMGLGRGPAGGDAWRRLGARARREAQRQGARRVAIHLGWLAGDSEVITAVAEGFLLAGYRFDRYKSERNDRARGDRLLLVEI